MNKIIFNRRVIYLVYILFFVGCGAGCGPYAAEENQLKIVGGTEVPNVSSDPSRTATVALTTREMFNSRQSFCTASLIGESILLTAAHCVVSDDGTLRPISIWAVFSLRVGSDQNNIRKVTKIVANPDYNGQLLPSGEDPERTPMNDLAVLKLDESTPSPYKPVLLVSPSVAFRDNQEVELAGYGVTATRNINNTGTLREVPATIIDANNKGNVLIVQGPELAETALLPIDSSGGLEKIPAHGGACAGDSGGPAFVQLGGKWFQAGVTSYGEELRITDDPSDTRYCVGRNGYVDLRKYRQTIDKLVAKVN